MKTALQQINNSISDLKNNKIKAFIAGASKDEELRYVLHNKNRFITAMSRIDEILTKKRGDIFLLDIGASPLTFILRKKYPNINISTLDISNNLAKRCKDAEINFVLADLNNVKKLPLNKKYDIILFLEVLEHLKSDHSLIIQWISKILKDEGTCILQTPNRYSLKASVVNLIGLSTWDLFSRRPAMPEEFTHFKEYSLSELKMLVSKIPSLTIIHSEYPLYFDTLSSSVVYRKFISLSKPFLFLHYLLVLLIPNLRRGMQIVFTKQDQSTTENIPSRIDYTHRFGLPPTPVDPSVIKSGVSEIVKGTQQYLGKPLKSISVLDAGSGWGDYTAEMAKYFGTVVGVEPQPKPHNYSVKTFSKIKNLQFYNSYIEDYTTKMKFDLVVSLTVFEHMSNHKKVFDKTFSLLKKNGIIYLTAPNKYWILEPHYRLPFLSWLPLSVSNKYLKLLRGVDSYEDCSYSLSYNGMKKFFKKYKCKYEFILPFDAEGAYFGYAKSQSLAVGIRRLGIRLIRLNPFFWNISKGFIMVITKTA